MCVILWLENNFTVWKELVPSIDPNSVTAQGPVCICASKGDKRSKYAYRGTRCSSVFTLDPAYGGPKEMVGIHTKFKQLPSRERAQRVMTILFSVNPMGAELLRPRSQLTSSAVPLRRPTRITVVQCGPFECSHCETKKM